MAKYHKYNNMQNTNLPWLKEIPSHWMLLQMKNIFQNITDKGHPQAEVLSLYREYGILPKNSRTDNHNVTSEDTASYKYVQIGDLVINKMKAWQGSLAVSNFEGIVSPAYYVCRFKNNQYIKRYFHYLLRCKAYAQEFERLSTGMRIGQWDLNINDFMYVPIIIPTTSEQAAIASYLDAQCSRIDSIIEDTKASIPEYKKLIGSIISEAVTKGMYKNVQLKNSGIDWIGNIPSHWQVCELHKLVTQVKNKNTALKEKNLLSLSYGKIIRKDINSYGGLLPESFDDYNIIEQNDIVLRLTDLQNDHTSLRVGRATERGIITSAYITLRPLNGKYSRYLYYLLHVFDLKKGFYGMGSGVRQSLKYNEVKNIYLAIPGQDEQNSIVDYLDTQCSRIDSIIKEKEALIPSLESYKRSLIYEIVTGKRKVV